MTKTIAVTPAVRGAMSPEQGQPHCEAAIEEYHRVARPKWFVDGTPHFEDALRPTIAGPIRPPANGRPTVRAVDSYGQITSG